MKEPGTFTLAHNRFTFNGLEYLDERYYNVFTDPQAQLKIVKQGNTLSVDAGGSVGKDYYYWYKTGNPNPVYTAKGVSSYQPAASGSYYVNVKNRVVQDLTLVSDTVAYVPPPVTGNTQPAISFYPNPVKGMMTLTGLSDKVNETITIADMSGYVWVRAVSHQQQNIRVNVSQLKAGEYLVTVSDGTGIKTVHFMKE